MADIVQLDELTINQIAAGEVIERPSSVVKELAENAIDAGATKITVEIKNGGIQEIKIVDNGKGIKKDDIEIAFERHATSKIRSAKDIEDVHTMGFRGEALASIAAISNVEMVTKTEQGMGYKIVVEAGDTLSFEEIGAPKGTSITVSNLFFNTPVRYKFLKKDYTEAGYVEDIVQKLALINKDISFTLINNGKTILKTNGAGDFKSVVYNIFGKDVAEGIVPVEYEVGTVKVTGVAGKPSIARSNRRNQIFYINERYIKDKTLSASIDRAYKGLIPKGRFAFCILNIETSPKFVDVNVHPSKIEVRFQNEKDVFRAVYHGVKDAIEKEQLIDNVQVSNSKFDIRNNLGENYMSLLEKQKQEKHPDNMRQLALEELYENKNSNNRVKEKENLKQKDNLKEKDSDKKRKIGRGDIDKDGNLTPIEDIFKNKSVKTEFSPIEAAKERYFKAISGQANSGLFGRTLDSKEDENTKYNTRNLSYDNSDINTEDKIKEISIHSQDGKNKFIQEHQEQNKRNDEKEHKIRSSTNLRTSFSDFTDKLETVQTLTADERKEYIEEKLLEYKIKKQESILKNRESSEKLKKDDKEEFSKINKNDEKLYKDNDKVDYENENIKQVLEKLEIKTDGKEGETYKKENTEEIDTETLANQILKEEALEYLSEVKESITNQIEKEEIKEPKFESKTLNAEHLNMSSEIKEGKIDNKKLNNDVLDKKEYKKEYKKELQKKLKRLNEIEEELEQKKTLDSNIAQKIIDERLVLNTVDGVLETDVLEDDDNTKLDFEKMYKEAFGEDVYRRKKAKEKIEIKTEGASTLKMPEMEPMFEGEIPPYKFIGVAFKTYIIIEMNQEIYMIDQHAAHERLLYEEVKQRYYSDEEKDVERLLMPDVITLSYSEIETIRQNKEVFDKAGFEFEEFGINTIKLTGVPVTFDVLNTKQLFLDILDEIGSANLSGRQEIEDTFLATIACKAAVKGNMSLKEEEIHKLLEDLFKLPNPFTCPHGRPTAIKISKYDLERKFSRK